MPLSTFLNGRAPSTLRGLQFLSLSDRGNVQTATITSDTGGGATQSWVTGGTIMCRLDPVSDRGGSRLIGGRVDERSTHIVTVPAGTGVSTSNRFLIAGRGTFEVTAERDRTAEATHEFEVIQIS
jgi:head-tail adaptor